MKYIVLVITLCTVCAYADLSGEVILPNNNESVRLELEEKYKMGAAGIPHLIKAIEDNIHNQYNPDSNSTVNHSVRYLYMLAKKGIYLQQEVPVLINLLKTQIHVKDTFLTAETIRLITKVDVGYSREFVNNYISEKESVRQDMIGFWENLEMLKN